MCKPRTLQSAPIPFPSDGLNLIASPKELALTEARQLDNYFIYDWGIRERGPFTSFDVPDGGDLISQIAFSNSIRQGVLVSSSHTHIYKLDSSGFSASVANKNFISPCIFNKKIMMITGATELSSFDIATETFSAAVSTPANNSFGCFVYRNRIYILNQSSTIEFLNIAATSGAIAGSFDFGQVFQRGTKLVFGVSWSYNQGFDNSELMVVANDGGEVLIYSGTYPDDDTTWKLVARIDVPCILGEGTPIMTYFNASFARLGQDILINTGRGVLSLSRIMAGRVAGSDKAGNFEYYSISNKLGPTIAGGVPAISQNIPFAYFAGQYPTDTFAGASVFVLNYEKGAWSRFSGFGTNNRIVSIGCTTGPATGQYSSSSAGLTFFALTDATVKMLRDTPSPVANDSTVSYVWATPYLNFDNPLQKISKMLRVAGRNISSSGNFINKVAISSGYNDTNIGTYSTNTTSITNSNYTEQELSPPGGGTELSCYFNKIGDNTSLNEISGVEVFYETGGVY